jgi:hypothetical protein
MNHAHGFFDDDELFRCVQERVRHSLSDKDHLKQNEPLSEVLERAVQEHGLEVFKMEEGSGLQEACKKGYLHELRMNPLSNNFFCGPSLRK